MYPASSSSGSGRRSWDARLEMSRSNSPPTLTSITLLSSSDFLNLVRLWPKEHPPSCRRPPLRPSVRLFLDVANGHKPHIGLPGNGLERRRHTARVVVATAPVVQAA